MEEQDCVRAVCDRPPTPVKVFSNLVRPDRTDRNQTPPPPIRLERVERDVVSPARPGDDRGQPCFGQNSPMVRTKPPVSGTSREVFSSMESQRMTWPCDSSRSASALPPR